MNILEYKTIEFLKSFSLTESCKSKEIWHIGGITAWQIIKQNKNRSPIIFHWVCFLLSAWRYAIWNMNINLIYIRYTNPCWACQCLQRHWDWSISYFLYIITGRDSECHIGLSCKSYFLVPISEYVLQDLHFDLVGQLQPTFPWLSHLQLPGTQTLTLLS